ncbi:MAG: Tex family protein [Cytophagales bacterium]|nr:RNA-binding transcriptional accessory protein [Bernardetiaceae bacterium]MDW8204376.1 Tex family protein [Cytophagales bacterium]
MDKHFLQIATELAIAPRQVQATVELLDGGATVPFIARYRKELTGSLDEVAIATIRDRIAQLRELEKRREAILESMREMGKLTPELEAAFMAAETITRLEDLYLPYRPKRRTKATEAKEKGLEPLADILMAQDEQTDLLQAVLSFINEEKGVKTIEEALTGARHIIAERISEDAQARANMRELFLQKGKFKAKVIAGKEAEAQKYKDYFDWEEDIAHAPSHRILAMRRAEKENFISLSSFPNEEEALALLINQFVKGDSPASEQVKIAVVDAYHRLLGPSMETEVRAITKKRADEEAIKVFADNLRQLLLASPLGEKRVLAIDPGFRTGCKVVCLDAQGKLLHNDTIYPHEPQKQTAEAGMTIRQLCEQYQIQAIAIGNGTAGRETEQFIRALHLPKNIQVVMVNESGASVYSASEVARREFPHHDVTVRGAVSIGRRLMDPLAELVKIDPKSIGVGQYQHDVDQAALKRSLDDVVISCVNAVGVEVNTASKELLTYVSGLGPSLAQNIVDYRNLYGPFKNRNELKKVPRLGDKVFEQAAGFLRIRNGDNPLDASAVHPESYHIVEQMAADLGCTVQDLLRSEELRKKINLKKYVTNTIGLPTLQDILNELAKPGRDPREQFEAFAFDERVHSITDLKVGMQLPGIVTNITNFGVFVDIGVHQDGLVHLSQIADRFIEHPSEVVKVHQRVMVTVTDVDVERKRISLSMKGNAPVGEQKQKKNNVAESLPKNRKRREPEEDMATLLAKLKSKFR